MEIKNTTFSEYMQELSDMYFSLFKIFCNEILEKLKSGEKLNKFELSFIALLLDLIEDHD